MKKYVLIAVIIITVLAVAMAPSKHAGNRKYCERNEDCAVQKVCGCCDEAVNKQNVEEVDCTGSKLKCMAACPADYDIACVENTCTIIPLTDDVE